MLDDKILDSDMDAGETAASYTYDFFLSAISMIDHTFGDAYAKQNPALVGALVQASSTNLLSLMQAANNLPDTMPSMQEMEEMEAFMQNLQAAMPGNSSMPSRKTTKKRKKKTTKKAT